MGTGERHSTIRTVVCYLDTKSYRDIHQIFTGNLRSPLAQPIGLQKKTSNGTHLLIYLYSFTLALVKLRGT